MKTKLLVAHLLFFLLSSCEDSFEIPVNESEQETIDYFNTTALGFEFGDDQSRITRKWTADMQIFVYGSASDELLAELNAIVAEINNLSTDDFEILLVDSESFANYHLYLIGHEEYAMVFPSIADELEGNMGFFNVDWSNTTQDLNWGTMYVDILRATELAQQKYLLRRALTQSLGFGHLSDTYTSSIFNDSDLVVTTYSDIDSDLIRLLYHPDLSSGLNEELVTRQVSGILLTER